MKGDDAAARDELREARVASEIDAARRKVAGLEREVLPVPCLGAMPVRMPAPGLEVYRQEIPHECDSWGRRVRSQEDCDDTLARVVERLRASVEAYRKNLEQLRDCLACPYFERCKVLSGR